MQPDLSVTDLQGRSAYEFFRFSGTGKDEAGYPAADHHVLVDPGNCRPGGYSESKLFQPQLYPFYRDAAQQIPPELFGAYIKAQLTGTLVNAGTNLLPTLPPQYFSQKREVRFSVFCPKSGLRSVYTTSGSIEALISR